jgi:hypothetical protein
MIPHRAIRVPAICLAFACIGVAPARADKTDRVTVAGVVIVGEVKSLQRGRLKFSTDFMETVEVDWAQITRIESKLWFEIETRSGERHFGRIVAGEEDRVLVVDTGEATLHFPYREIVSIDQARTGFWGKIDAGVGLGVSFVQGTETTQASLDAYFKRRTGRFASSLSLGAVVSDTREDRTSRSDISYTATRNLPGRWTYGLAAQFQTNESLGLDQRYLVRGGPIYRLLRTDTRELELGVGAAFTRENYNTGVEGDSGFEGVLGLNYNAFHFDDPEVKVSLDVKAYPSFSVSGRWRTELNADVQRELGWDLSWVFRVYWSYDNRPVGLSKGSDLSVSASLAWDL